MPSQYFLAKVVRCHPILLESTVMLIEPTNIDNCLFHCMRELRFEIESEENQNIFLDRLS